jgi:hypothetical protein
MNNDLQPEDVTLGMDIWFFNHPKDSVPTLRTKVKDIDEDRRGKVVLLAKGVEEYFPIYHFRKPNPETEKYSSAVSIEECDDLYKRAGI